MLTVTDLVISTVECSVHDETAHAAGIELDDIFNQDLDAFEVGKKHLRLQISKDSLEIELWFFKYWSHAGNPHEKLPVPKEKLDELAAWTLAHPRMRGAFGRNVPGLVITLRDDPEAVWEWRDGELARNYEGHLPAP